MLLLAISSGAAYLMMAFLAVCFIICNIAAIIDIERYDVKFGGETWKEWLKDLFTWKKEEKAIPNEFILAKNFIKEFSSETPPSPGPYSGSEWSSSDPSMISSPTQTEAPVSDQASSCSEAASSSQHGASSAPTRTAASARLAHDELAAHLRIPRM